MAGAAGPGAGPGAAGGDGDDSLYPIAVLIDELRNEDVQVLGWGWGVEERAEAHMVEKREGRLSRGGGPGDGRAVFSARRGRGGGGSVVVRLDSQQLDLEPLGWWHPAAPAVGGEPSQFSPPVDEHRWVAGGLRGRPGAEERPGHQAAFEALRSACLCWQTGLASWVGRAPQLINTDEWCISCDGTFL